VKLVKSALEPAAPLDRPTPRRVDPFEVYEAEKRRLEARGLSPEEYEQAIRELTKRLGI
jgi:hypothetical protein